MRPRRDVPGGTEGRQVAFARPQDWLPAAPERPETETAAAELVRRYLGAYGPSTRKDFATWSNLPAATFDVVSEEVVEVEGRGWILAEDADRLADPPRIDGVRLLPTGDPFLRNRDRETLVEDKARRQQIWRPIGSPGVVIADGEIAGTWRPKKAGKRLEVTIEAFGQLDMEAVAEAADRLAPHRGCETAVLK